MPIQPKLASPPPPPKQAQSAAQASADPATAPRATTATAAAPKAEPTTTAPAATRELEKAGVPAIAEAAAADYGALPFQAAAEAPAGPQGERPAGGAGQRLQPDRMARLLEAAGDNAALKVAIASADARGLLVQPTGGGVPLDAAIWSFITAKTDEKKTEPAFSGNVPTLRQVALSDGVRVRGHLSPEARRKLAGTVLKQILTPTNIRQVGQADTCVAVNAQMLWAISQPGEYFRAATRLVDEGTASFGRMPETNDGKLEMIRLDVDRSLAGKDNTKFINDEPLNINDTVNAAVQAALTSFSVGGRYFAATDAFKHKGKNSANEGLTRTETSQLLRRLTGTTPVFSTNDAATLEASRATVDEIADGAEPAGFYRSVDEGLKALADRLEKGREATAVIRSPEGAEAYGHLVKITAVGKDRVRFVDGFGKHELPAEDFKALMDLNPQALAAGGVGGGSSYTTAQFTSGSRLRTATTVTPTTKPTTQRPPTTRALSGWRP
jgi:hypothetical protein